jgi:hypothetical protein
MAGYQKQSGILGIFNVGFFSIKTRWYEPMEIVSNGQESRFVGLTRAVYEQLEKPQLGSG